MKQENQPYNKGVEIITLVYKIFILHVANFPSFFFFGNDRQNECEKNTFTF